MPQFRVTLTNSTASGVITHDGYLGKRANFNIQRLLDRKTYVYEGHGGGKAFEMRCQLLVAAGGVVVEASNPDATPADTTWKEAIVNKALEQAERLQDRRV